MVLCSENCLEKGNQEYITSEAFVKSDFTSQVADKRITLAWELQSRAHRAGTRWPVLKSYGVGTSLMVQWIRIHLPMQGTWVQSLVLEDSTCRGAPKPVSHDYWDSAETTEAREPRACALQQEKSWQWEALALQRKSSSCQPRLEKKAQ